MISYAELISDIFVVVSVFLFLSGWNFKLNSWYFDLICSVVELRVNPKIWKDCVIFFSVIILLIIIKLLTYAFYYEHLEMDKFMQEFKKIEREEKKKWKQMIND